MTTLNDKIAEAINNLEELFQKIKDEQKPKKWMPKDGDTVYIVSCHGKVYEEEYKGHIKQSKITAGYYRHNNLYPTRKEAEKAALRMESAERRYLPEEGEEYKSICRDGKVTKYCWYSDMHDTTRYHNGMVWHKDTPDEEVRAWYKKYGDAWKVTMRN